MSRAQRVLRRGQRHSEALMVDRVKVTRVSTSEAADGTITRSTIQVYPDPDWPDDHPHKRGKAKLANQNQYESTPTSAGHTFVVQRSLIHFPVGSFQMQNGDVAEFIHSEAPFVAGSKYRLTGEAPYRTFETAYRVYVDQIVD